MRSATCATSRGVSVGGSGGRGTTAGIGGGAGRSGAAIGAGASAGRGFAAASGSAARCERGDQREAGCCKSDCLKIQSHKLIPSPLLDISVPG
mgnify:CR=1 FL=1